MLAQPRQLGPNWGAPHPERAAREVVLPAGGGEAQLVDPQLDAVQQATDSPAAVDVAAVVDIAGVVVLLA